MKLLMTENDYEKIINHCKRKLDGIFNEDETKENQAFGAIVGKKVKDGYCVTEVIYLKKNYRFETVTSKKMNEYIEKFAIPGGIEVSERAWAIHPSELNEILMNLKGDEEFIGTYHMHNDASWAGDYPKELPTKLDRELNINSGLINLITYIGTNEQKIRAFFESDVKSEYELIIEKE